MTEPLVYVVIWVQIPQVPSYNGDQVALVVCDDGCFISRCPVVLGTPMIDQAVQVMKEMELGNAQEAWQSARYSNEYANYMAQLDPE